MNKYVYLFHEGHAQMKHILGGKGANLAEMTHIGLPVPPGFTISTEACTEYYQSGKVLTPEIKEQIEQALEKLEQTTGKKLNDSKNPLLVSVRSGSVFSMPGMMDTVLNLGLNDETVLAIAKLTDNPRFAYDSYRRFIQMFSDVVLGIDHYFFERVIDDVKESKGLTQDTELNAEDWQEVIAEYKKIVLQKTKEEFPQNPFEQLEKAILAVFDSWNNDRAKVYRKIHQIPDHLGTAVNIQMMVFGNMGDDSGTGVAFTRNPSTGSSELYGEYLMNAQGEDVVAGIRTPKPIHTLKDNNPAIYEQFYQIAKKLELHYQDMQDIEFTIEKGSLYLLQTRNGKRTTQAAVKIAVDLVREQLISKEEALLRVDPDQLNQVLHRQIDYSQELNVIAKGLPASPGAASGKIVFDANDAEKMSNNGEKVILVRPETTPEDIHGIVAAQGILTSRGGMTSHAAVVARGMGKACIAGCEALKIDLKNKEIAVNQHILREGDQLSIDGSTGKVFLGTVSLIDPQLSEEFRILLHWADEIKQIDVRANADNPEDAKKAREFGARGIGLCRTEHMFMDLKRIPIVQEMILAEEFAERKKALDKLLPMQKEDFKGILKEMAGFPVTIRLLDPPLHEFLPDAEELIVEITKLKMTDSDVKVVKEKEQLWRKVKNLSEMNPMLGHRGCRLGITYPEIYAMQTEAIFKAAIELKQEDNLELEPEIMIPLVAHENELKLMRKVVEDVAEKVMNEHGISFPYKIGTMIEIPRAALTADEIANHAEFFSFGTNDLTQTTFGFSRDDAEGKFLHQYVDRKILSDNPFVTIDRNGVGKLIEMGTSLGRKVKPNLKVGICGEHGGEKKSIEFCYQTGLDYVSCSPFRVPLARLAAAQATIKNKDQ